jgi:hypothetical protein
LPSDDETAAAAVDLNHTSQPQTMTRTRRNGKPSETNTKNTATSTSSSSSSSSAGGRKNHGTDLHPPTHKRPRSSLSNSNTSNHNSNKKSSNSNRGKSVHQSESSDEGATNTNSNHGIISNKKNLVKKGSSAWSKAYFTANSKEKLNPRQKDLLRKSFDFLYTAQENMDSVSFAGLVKSLVDYDNGLLEVFIKYTICVCMCIKNMILCFGAIDEKKRKIMHILVFIYLCSELYFVLMYGLYPLSVLFLSLITFLFQLI